MSTPVQHKRNFFDFFPTPKFLEMPSVGIDISDQAVRFVEIARSQSGHTPFHLKHFGEKKIPDGVMAGGYISKPEEIKKVLADIHKERGFKFASVSIPEEKGYLFKTILPNIEEKYVAENIELHLEENVPIDAAKSVFDYSLVRSKDGHRHTEAVVTVVPNKVIDVYSNLFHSASIVPISYELVTQAVARSVVPQNEMSTCLIVHLGDARIGFGIVSDGALQFTSTVNAGRPINPMDVGKIFSLLKDEVVKLIIYWQNKNDGDLKPIKKVIVSGKDATTQGYRDALAEASSCPVDLANVWVNVFNFSEQIPEMTFENSLDYAPAIGLALSRFHNA